MMSLDGFGMKKAKDIPTFDCPSWEEVPKSEFDHMGSRVTEFKLVSGNKVYIGWVKSPIEKLITDGFLNPIFHDEYIAGDYDGEAQARSHIRELYNKYYQNPAKTYDEYKKLCQNDTTAK